MNKANLAGYERFNDRVCELSDRFKYSVEWGIANKSGWDDDEFYQLYVAYLESTQVQPSESEGGSATELKGRPLERIARFFLERGGVALDIRELSAPSRWQIDGQGLVCQASIERCFDIKLVNRIGFQVYIECKNHNEPVSNTDYARHEQRMSEHCCNLGVMFSTSGYSMSRGTGISDSIYFNSARDKFHVLFTVDIFMKLIDEDKPPLFLFKEVFGYTVNERYRHDRELQNRYSCRSCQLIAEAEHNRYCL